MAKAKKAKRTAARTTATTRKRAPAKRTSMRSKSGSSQKTGMMGGLLDFMPSNLMKDILASQTSRVIIAEALVAAATAAAAVLVASRTESGQRAGKALAEGGALVKEAAVNAAAAARDVIASGATEAIGSAARSLMGATEETQKEIAEKALRLKRDAKEAAADVADNARRYADRDRPH
jgi:hypothetical protein